MRALFSAVTGVRSHQVRMDVIGNNIANVNTTGFKASRVTFQDIFSQTISAGSAQTTPQQIGLGVGVATTDLFTEAGGLQMTGRELDLAIEGSGMFILRGGDGQNLYSRAGSFSWDADGLLVNPGTGARVQGWMADANGVISSVDQASLSDIQIVRGEMALAQPTSEIAMAGNLDAGAPDSTEYTTTLAVYDSLGRAHSLIMTMTKQSDNMWTSSVEGTNGLIATGNVTLQFDTNGMLMPGSPDSMSVDFTPNGAAPQTVNVDLSTVTQGFAGSAGSNVLVRKADGYPMGTLESVTIDASGTAFGVYSNGFRRPLAQIGMALFSNPAGLLKVGASSFAETASSGGPQIGRSETGGRGRVVPGNLEMSNVDLSTEFTNLIMTQRGFQANTRIISTADEMMQELVNLRR
jgi:flagellar hook protein FlgE